MFSVGWDKTNKTDDTTLMCGCCAALGVRRTVLFPKAVLCCEDAALQRCGSQYDSGRPPIRDPMWALPWGGGNVRSHWRGHSRLTPTTSAAVSQVRPPLRQVPQDAYCDRAGIIALSTRASDQTQIRSQENVSKGHTSEHDYDVRGRPQTEREGDKGRQTHIWWRGGLLTTLSPRNDQAIHVDIPPIARRRNTWRTGATCRNAMAWRWSAIACVPLR